MKEGNEEEKSNLILPIYLPPKTCLHFEYVIGLLHFLAWSQPLMEPPPCWSVVLLSWSCAVWASRTLPKVESFIWLPGSCEKSWLTVGQSLSRALGGWRNVKEPCSGREVSASRSWEALLVSDRFHSCFAKESKISKVVVKGGHSGQRMVCVKMMTNLLDGMHGI